MVRKKGGWANGGNDHERGRHSGSLSGTADARGPGRSGHDRGDARYHPTQIKVVSSDAGREHQSSRCRYGALVIEGVLASRLDRECQGRGQRHDPVELRDGLPHVGLRARLQVAVDLVEKSQHLAEAFVARSQKITSKANYSETTDKLNRPTDQPWRSSCSVVIPALVSPANWRSERASQAPHAWTCCGDFGTIGYPGAGRHSHPSRGVHSELPSAS